MKLTTDQLQNELIVLVHHFDDIEQSIKKGDGKYALEGLKDAREAVKRLEAFLPRRATSEIERIAESLE